MPTGGAPASRGGMRLQSAARGGNAINPLQSVGMTTNVEVDIRPVTRQGLTGMNTGKPLGPGRQIADDRYFTMELRTKITSIQKEMERMEDEKTTIAHNNQKYAHFEREYEKTIKEVRTLEGELADYNLAQDKYRSNTDVNDINDAFERLKQMNESERSKVDDIFIKWKNIDKKTTQLQGNITEIYNTAGNRMQALGPGVQQEYKNLQQEKEMIQNQMEEKEQRVRELDMKINQHQAVLKSAEYKIHTRGMELQKKKKHLIIKVGEMKEEADTNLNPEQVEERLRDKIKALQSDLEQREKTKTQVEDNVDRLQAEVAKREQELSEAQKYAQKSKQIEKIYERDRKMQDLIDTHPDLMNKENDNKGRLKKTIVALLKHISKSLNAAKNIPDAETLSEMKRELTFKDRQLANSKDTLTLLKQESKKKQEELDKINNLDLKINKQTKALQAKIADMKDKMATFKTEDEMRSDAAEYKKQLLVEQTVTKQKREALKRQVAIEAHAFEATKREMAGNETIKRIESLEQKLKIQSQTVYTLDEFISSRKRESDYHGILNVLKEMSSEINQTIVADIQATA